MSARVLFTCWPFEGHVMPQMSIAVALRDRGHDVAFYTGEAARPNVEEEGFAMFPLQRVAEAWRPVQELERRTVGRRQSLRVQRRAFRDWLAETIPAQVDDVRAIVDDWRPDLIACDLSMWGPIAVLWEADEIPVALSSTFMGPLIPGPDAPPWGFGLAPPRTRRARLRARALTRATDAVAHGLRRRVDEIRAGHGLPAMGCSVNEHTGRLPLYLVGSLPELDYGRRDLPPSVHYVGPCVWHPATPPGTAAWLDGIPAERPWVHVTEGTSHYQDPFLLRAAVQGLKDVEVVATTGNRREPGELGLGAAPNVHLTQWVSHGELLPRCRAVVTTGGPATIMAALRVGVPVVVVPTTWDKPDNARRVVEAGVGVRLAPRRCTSERLEEAVMRVLEDPGYAARAADMAQRLARAPGPPRAAELLETLAQPRAVA